MKPRTGFWIWLLFLPCLVLVQHFRLRPFPHIVLLFWLSVPPVAIAWLFWQRRRVSVDVSPHPPVVERQQPFSVALTVTNPLRVGDLQVTTHPQDRPSAIAAGETATLRQYPQPPHVGLFSVPDEPLYLSDPFRLFFMPLPVSVIRVVVQPRVSEAMIPAFGSIGNLRAAPKHEPTRRPGETAFVEPLTPGMPIVHIHRTLTARMQEWIVRRFEKEEENECLLTAYRPDDPDVADLLYDTMAAAGRQLLADGFSVRVISTHGSADPFRRPESLNALRTALAFAAADESEAIALEKWHPNTQSVMVFCDALTEDIVASARVMAQRVPAVAVVALKAPPASFADALQKDGIVLVTPEVEHA